MAKMSNFEVRCDKFGVRTGTTVMSASKKTRNTNTRMLHYVQL